jgi:hypothetical protein
MARTTTVRFGEDVYTRLEGAAARSGLPINSIVISACLDWLAKHEPREQAPITMPRRSTLARMARLITVAAPRGRRHYSFDRFSPAAQAVLRRAQEEAEKVGPKYIGTEHLLLALLHPEAGRAAKVLERLGVGEGDVRERLAHVIPLGAPVQVTWPIPTSRTRRIIELAFGEAAAGGSPTVEPEHLLLGVAAEGEGIAARVMADLGVTVEAIRQALAQESA